MTIRAAKTRRYPPRDPFRRPGRHRDRRPAPCDCDRDRRSRSRRPAGDRRQGSRNRTDDRRRNIPLRRCRNRSRRRGAPRPAGHQAGRWMTPLWTAADATRATGGASPAGWTATGVSIDSRTLAAGDLFIALRGPNHDGHDFVVSALERGAAAAMVDRQIPGLPAGAALLHVDDTLAGLGALGGFARTRNSACVIAVTGSVGKTGTKEALRLALAACGKTFASADSFNNHWGVPLSLARMPPHTVYGVFEIGMNHPGEIDALTRLVRPHIALVTTVEAVHFGFFGSVEAIADAK